MPISDYVPPDTPTNNDYLTRIAGGVDPDATLDPRMTNNDLLRIIAEGTSGLAHLDSPALMGTPTAPTADAGDESAQIATTEFVQQEIEARVARVEARVATIESDLAETITDAATTRAGLATVASDLGSLVLEVGSNTSRIAESERRIDSMRRGLLRRDGDWYDNASITAFLAARFDGKLYGYLEPKTTATEVAKTGANAGMPNPTLGTALVAGSSKYRDIGPFQWFAAKGVVDSDGVPHMRVIRGIDSEDAWDACTDNVWAIHPVVWYDVDDTGDAVIGSVSDTWHQGLRPNPQAYLPDGTLRPYMVRPRYALGLENGVCVSKSGLMGYSHTFDASHNGLISNIGYATSGYSGKSIYDQWYDAFFSRMIYGTKDFQTVMMGCVSYNYQYNPAVAETGTDRVVLTNAQAANLVVGSSMMLGTRLGTQDNDRARTQNYDVFDGLRIESIEEYDSTRMAVTFDATFDTATTHLLSTAPWHSGSCDAMDWDGSPANPLSGREPAFFQGAEILAGTYETLAGVILSNDGSGWVPYVTHDTRDDATSVTEDFTALDALPTSDTDGWKYPLYVSDHGGLMYGTTTGASATSGASDGCYTNKSSVVGTRQWRSGGNLGSGRHAGPSCVDGGHGLGDRSWDRWSRLSGTGRSRG